jgi:hypothetical protein
MSGDSQWRGQATPALMIQNLIGDLLIRPVSRSRPKVCYPQRPVPLVYWQKSRPGAPGRADAGCDPTLATGCGVRGAHDVGPPERTACWPPRATASAVTRALLRAVRTVQSRLAIVGITLIGLEQCGARLCVQLRCTAANWHSRPPRAAQSRGNRDAPQTAVSQVDQGRAIAPGR